MLQAPLHRILSLSQNRIPGAIAKVFVECLAGPGHICQAHLRMVLEYGDTIRIMLIPIWVLKFYHSVTISNLKRITIYTQTSKFSDYQNFLEILAFKIFVAICFGIKSRIDYLLLYCGFYHCVYINPF